MKVSVVIPVYNAAPYLRECVDSVLAQTHRDLDVILVDDGSTDSSPEICDEYAGKDARVRVLHCDNGGMSIARNRGIDASVGSHIVFVDSDDELHPRMVELVLDAMTESGAQLCSCAFVRCRNAMWLSRKPVVVYEPEDAVEKLFYQDKDLNASAWGHIFARELFDNSSRFTPGIAYEDLDLLHKLYMRADKVAHICDALYFYRNTPGSIINTWSLGRLDVLDVTEKIERCYRNNKRLLAAARDRRLSAAFNMFALNAINGADRSLEKRCVAIIKERRLACLFNTRVRLKNKLGIVVSYLGVRAMKCAAKWL